MQSAIGLVETKGLVALIEATDAMAKAAAAGIAQSKMIEYQGGSHGIVLTERDRVTRDLQSFIAS